MATIQKRQGKSGTHFRVEVRLKGALRQTATFVRLTDARNWAQETEVAIRQGRHFPSRKKRRRTVREMLERYIDEVLPHRRAAKDAHRTAAQLRWLDELLGDYYLSGLTPSRIAAVRDELAAGNNPSGQLLSPATCNRYLAVLSHVCSIACREWEWLDSNPVSKVRRLREPRGRVRFLGDQERDRLLIACRTSTESRLYPLVILALGTGARQGELLSMRWRDVDLRRNTLIFHHTKNNERRAVPLTGSALETMNEMASEPHRDDVFVFANTWGRPSFPRRAWECALEEAEIENFRFHDLRQSTASYLAMSGATLAEIAEVLGHKTLAMVKRYSHLTEAHTRSVLARMTAKF